MAAVEDEPFPVDVLDPEPHQPDPLWTAPEPRQQSFPLHDHDRTRYKPNASINIMREAMSKTLPGFVLFRLQVDGGAYLSVTNNIKLLIHVKQIKRHAIGGVAEGHPALYATAVGYLPWCADNGALALVKCYIRGYYPHHRLRVMDTTLQCGRWHRFCQFP